MSGSHEKLPWLFWVQLILVAIVGTLYLLAPKAEKHNSAEAEGVSSEVKEATNNLKPVGQVAKKSSTPAGSAKPRSGKKVYDTACGACHTAGIANAPKPDDKAAWEPRMAQGMEGLMKTAINGKGAMPPRGGNPTVTDEEIKAAIIYMTKQAGFDLGSGQDDKKETSVAVKTTTEDTKASTKETSADVSKDEKVVATPPVKPSMTKAPDAKTAPVAPKAPAAPIAAVVTTTSAVAAVAVEKVAAVTQDSAAKEKNTSEKNPAAMEMKVATKEGEKLYNSMCFSCHATGVANSPKLDDKAVWAPRIAAGYDVLYDSAIKGKGVMPPKGGNMSLSDDAVKAAVDYMVSKVK